jgi:hypothetical protein
MTKNERRGTSVSFPTEIAVGPGVMVYRRKPDMHMVSSRGF